MPDCDRVGVVNRFPIRCGACGADFVARVELSPSNGTRFAFPCPACSYPIRGRYFGLELDELRVEWEDAQSGSADANRELGREDLVITVGTTVPLRPSTWRLDQFGGGPNLTFGHLVGDNHAWANNYHGRLHELGPFWRQYDRLLHFYGVRDWAKFNSAGRKLVGTSWSDARNAQERLIAAIRPAQVMLLPLLPGDISRRLISDYVPDVQNAIDSESFTTWATGSEGESELVDIESRLFRVLQAYVRDWETWSAGILVRATEPARRPALAKLRLYRDEFVSLRDLYIQAFETCCAALVVAAGIINCARRSDPNSFGAVPAGILASHTNAKAPASLKKFADLANATKLKWFEDWPEWSAVLPVVLDKDLRNNLGHASAVHDIGAGRIIGHRLDMSYLELTARVMELGHVILVLLQLTKSVRLQAMDQALR